MISGVPGGVNPSAGAAANRAASSANTSPIQSFIQKSPALQNVLDGLGIKSNQVSKVTTQSGAQVQLLPVTQDRASVLSALGLGGAVLSISVASNDELDKIRKRLESVRQSMVSAEDLERLMKALGLPFDEDAIVFTDESTGGLVLIRSAMSEIEESITEE